MYQSKYFERRKRRAEIKELKQQRSISLTSNMNIWLQWSLIRITTGDPHLEQTALRHLIEKLISKQRCHERLSKTGEQRQDHHPLVAANHVSAGIQPSCPLGSINRLNKPLRSFGCHFITQSSAKVQLDLKLKFEPDQYSANLQNAHFLSTLC